MTICLEVSHEDDEVGIVKLTKFGRLKFITTVIPNEYKVYFYSHDYKTVSYIGICNTFFGEIFEDGGVIFSIHYQSSYLFKFVLEKSIDDFLELVNFIKYLDFESNCIPLEYPVLSKIQYAKNKLKSIERNRTW